MADKSETGSASPSPGTGKRPRRRWLRRIAVAAVLLLVVLSVLVLIGPTLLSTAAGRRYALGVVNDQIAGEVGVDGLSVGWLSGQSLTGVVVRDADGTQVARVGRVALPDAPLLSLVRGGLTLGRIEVEQVTADIVGYEDGTTNLQRALSARGAPPVQPGRSGKSSPKPGQTPPAAAWPGGLSFAITLRDIDITYRAAGVDEPIRLTVSDADLSASDPAHLELKLNAELSQAQRAGAVTADTKIDQLFDAAGVYQPGSAIARVNAEVADLPIDLLDTLLEQDGKLLALLGPVLNGRVLADVTASGGTASVQVKSEYLDINAKAAFDPAGVTQAGASAVRLTLTPQAWTALTATDGTNASTLAEPVEVAIELRRLGLPINDRGLDLTNVNLDLGLTLGDMSLLIDGVGEITLASTTGGIRTTQLGRSLAASFNTTSGINRKPGGVNLEVVVADLIDKDQRVNTVGLSAKVNGQLTNAPLAAILDELMPGVTHGLATRTLGPAVDAQIVADVTPRTDGGSRAGSFEFDLLTTGGEAGMQSTLIGRFDQDPQAINADLYDGSFLKFTVTPGLVSAYQRAFAEPGEDGAQPDHSAVALGGPAAFKLDLTRAAVGMKSDGGGGYAFNPAGVKLTGKLTSPKLALDRGGESAVTLKGLLVGIATDGLAGDTTLTLNADIDYPAPPDVPPAGEPRPGTIKSTTTVGGLVNARGQLAFESASYQTNTHIRRAPIDLIDAVLDMQGDLVASVGPRARVDAVGSYAPGEDDGTGGIDLTLKSRSASADMKLLVEDGRWALKADAPLSFQVTPRLSQTMLKKVMPFLGGAVSARLPIGVTLRQEGFSAPVRDMGIADVNADIRLELGELDLKGEGVLKKVLEQLGVGGRSLLNARFSPVTINLAGGKLSYQDLTMSIDDVVLGFSGQVDLGSEQLDLRMTIPGTSLANISWLKGAIAPDQVIVVPLTGTFDKPSLDVKLLTGEIAKAALQGQLKGVAGDAIGDKIGGEAGAAVTGLLNEILTGTKPQDGAQDTADESPQQPDGQPAQPDAQQKPTKPATDRPLTVQERKARRERRLKRRERLERLEREQAQRQAQDPQP
jgi:hypothetical protein